MLFQTKPLAEASGNLSSIVFWFITDSRGIKMKNLELFTEAENYFRKLSTLILPVVLFLICAANSEVFSQITVDRTDDSGAASAAVCSAAGNDCSLRGAFAFANTNSGTTINVPAGTYNLTIDELQVGTTTNVSTTINGAGANLVTINQTVANRRVIDLNPTLAANVVVNLSGVRITGGNTPSDNFGGGGLIGGGAANTLNLTNCIFENNRDVTSTAKGGAVEWAGGGFLNINNCTFNNNTAGSAASNRGVGGAVDYNLLNLAGTAGQGGLTITNSTFTGNKAGAENSGAGGAVGVTVTTQQTPRTVSITNNTFTGNQANSANNGLGGAITSSSAFPITVKFNRIVNNTATGGATGIYQTLGTTGTIDATENWWGCNLGPNNPGCNSIGGLTANITANPRIVLTLSASPNPPLVTNQSMSLTASFLRDSANNVLTLGNISELIGLPISFVPVRGQISGAQTVIQANGTATATFTATSAGAGSVAGVVDNSNDAVLPITINKANTTISIISDSPDPTVTGQQYTVTFGAVQVTSPGSGLPTAPTGTITVSDGANTCTVNVSATSCLFQSFTAGIKNLTATYSGDANFNASPASSAITHTVNKADTTVSLSAPNPTVFGQSYAASAVPFIVFPGTGTPTGTITVTDGTNNCTITLPATNCNLPGNYIGTRNLTATYNGDANYNASPASNQVSHTVNPADTLTTITSDAPDPSRVGQNVTVTFTVVVQSPGVGTPTGNVTVSDGTNSCTASVATGQCVLNFSAIGNYSLTATYQGNTNFNSSVSVVEPHTVCQPTTVQVTNNSDSGAGSLRQTILDSCSGNVITFAPGVTGTISVSSLMSINKDLVIQGAGANILTLAGNSANGVFSILGGATVSISGLTISNSVLNSGNGGAISNNGNLTLTAVVVKDSSANIGGGIFNNGQLTVDRSTISNNFAFGNGGGIESAGNSSSSLTVTNSTISGNRAGGFGGGVDIPTGTSNLTNTTVINNRADNDNNGGETGGGIYTNSSGVTPATLRNNIIANNFVRAVGNNPLANDIGGNNITNAFYNLIGNAASSGGITHGINGNQVGSSGSGTVSISSVIDTNLADNGGTTPTHKLVTGSPAIDKGSAATAPLPESFLAAITTDQRGVARPYDNPNIPNAAGGDGSDIGAYEIAAPTAASVSVGGRILTLNGRGIGRARIILTMPNGETRTTQSNQFGYFRFAEVEVGETYIFAVQHKQYSFSPQVININDALENLNFTANSEQ